MVTQSGLESIASARIAPRVDVDGELIIRSNHGGRDGNLYSLRVKTPESGHRVIGPHGHAAEFEYFLRGVEAGIDLATGRYAADDND